MSICDTCIHDDVCGLEDNHEEGIVSCADRIPKDVFDKIRAELIKWIDMPGGSYEYDAGLKRALTIIDKYREGKVIEQTELSKWQI